MCTDRKDDTLVTLKINATAITVDRRCVLITSSHISPGVVPRCLHQQGCPTGLTYRCQAYVQLPHTKAPCLTLRVGVNSLSTTTDFGGRNSIGINTTGISRVGTNNILTQTAGANNIGTKTVIKNTNYVGTHSINTNHICYQHSPTLSP